METIKFNVSFSSHFFSFFNSAYNSIDLCLCAITVVLWIRNRKSEAIRYKIRLNGTAFVRRLNCMVVLRAMPNLGVLCWKCTTQTCTLMCGLHIYIERTKAKQTKPNRKSSPENCLSSILNHTYMYKNVEKAEPRVSEREMGHTHTHNTPRRRAYSFLPYCFYCSRHFLVASLSLGSAPNHCSDCCLVRGIPNGGKRQKRE